MKVAMETHRVYQVSNKHISNVKTHTLFIRTSSPKIPLDEEFSMSNKFKECNVYTPNFSM